MLVATKFPGNFYKLILTGSMSKEEPTTKSVPISPLEINSRWQDPFVAISKNHEKQMIMNKTKKMKQYLFNTFYIFKLTSFIHNKQHLCQRKN